MFQMNNGHYVHLTDILKETSSSKDGAVARTCGQNEGIDMSCVLICHVAIGTHVC